MIYFILSKEAVHTVKEILLPAINTRISGKLEVAVVSSEPLKAWFSGNSMYIVCQVQSCYIPSISLLLRYYFDLSIPVVRSKQKEELKRSKGDEAR